MPSLFTIMNKLVIANKGAAEVGKSSSIMTLYRLMVEEGYKLLSHTIGNAGRDVEAIFEIKGSLVGLESEGDPGESMNNCINKFIEHDCWIIVTACRTKRDSFEVVNTRLRSAGYDIVWVSHDKYDDKNDVTFIERLNTLYAHHMLKLILNRIDSKI